MRREIQTPAYQNLYRDFEAYIDAKGFKGKMYRGNVRSFLIWSEQKGITDIKQIQTSDMMDYYQYLNERPNKRNGDTLADNTIKLHLLSISLFVEYLLDTGELVKAFYIPRHGNQDQKPRNFLTLEEIKILYQNTDTPLERAVLAVAYGCGLRRSEMQLLNTSDIQLSKGMLIVRNGKGDKRREVPMSDMVLEDIKKYITDYRYQQNNYKDTAFFISKRGTRMSGCTISKKLKKIIERTQNQTIIDKEISLHSLRHSIANHLVENNASLDFVRSFLGHSYLNTSYIYAIRNKKAVKSKKRLHQLKTTTIYE